MSYDEIRTHSHQADILELVREKRKALPMVDQRSLYALELMAESLINIDFSLRRIGAALSSKRDQS